MLALNMKQIHMNRWKGTTTTQITLEDDFIVPDSMEDIEQILLKAGDITIDSTRNLDEKVQIRGKMDFDVLYRTAEGSLQSLAGSIPLEETVNVPGLLEKDDTEVMWELEDLEVTMINSRKVNVKAIVQLQIRVETLEDIEAAADVDEKEREELQVQVLEKQIAAAPIAVRKKDTYRIQETVTLPGNKPNIDHILWTDMKLQGSSCRPLDGKLRLDGELMIFVIYQGEQEDGQIQWLEESIPYAGELELPEAVEEMVPAIRVRLAHKEMEARPDYDGELRELAVDAVLEVNSKLYEEQNIDLIGDLYSTNRELELVSQQACFDQIVVHNTSKCKLSEKFPMENKERILQLCHSEGIVRIDDTEIEEQALRVEGVLEVTLLYLTDDDREPVRSVVEQIPFDYRIEAEGIRGDSIYQLTESVEQLTAVMLGGEQVEIRGVIVFDLLVLQQTCYPVISQVEVHPMDLEAIEQLPGITGYIVQPGDSMWTVAKHFHTTPDIVRETNGMTTEEVEPGMRLVLVKQVS